MDPQRIFLFIDLNSYFATVEQQANLSLRGKPIGVCEHSGGIILAPSREAKKFGIKTGTPTWEAKKICPGIILLPVDPGKIRAMTSRFYRLAEDYSDAVEHVSVDEVAIDLTRACFNWPQAVETALEIKQRMKKEMGEWMSASIGIAESRLLAKIGTNLQKPDGLVLIFDEENDPSCLQKLNDRPGLVDKVKVFKKSELYDSLAIDDVPGIGPRLKKSLSSHGLKTLRELSAVPVDTLHSWYGVTGVWLYDLSHFRDAWREVDLDDRGVKSIGHQYALGKRNAFYKKEKALGLLWKLAEKVTTRLRQQELQASSVSVYLGYAAGSGIGGSRRVADIFDDTPTVMKVAERLIAGADFKQGISFLHISVSGLGPKLAQGTLFAQPSQKVPAAMDKINQRHGDFSIMYGQTLAAEDLAGDTIGFGRTRERLHWTEE